MKVIPQDCLQIFWSKCCLADYASIINKIIIIWWIWSFWLKNSNDTLQICLLYGIGSSSLKYINLCLKACSIWSVYLLLQWYVTLAFTKSGFWWSLKDMEIPPTGIPCTASRIPDPEWPMYLPTWAFLSDPKSSTVVGCTFLLTRNSVCTRLLLISLALVARIYTTLLALPLQLLKRFSFWHHSQNSLMYCLFGSSICANLTNFSIARLKSTSDTVCQSERIQIRYFKVTS